MESVANPPSRFARHILLLIVLSAACRLALASILGLSVDEAYAVVLGRHLDASYFDHPPMTFWLAGLSARLAGSEDPLVVRTPFILLFAGTTWLLYRLGARLLGEGAGVWGAVLLNLALVFTMSMASGVLPDGPLLFWSVAAAHCLARAVLEGRAGFWNGFGLCVGLALLAKYHAVFLLLGACVFLLTSPEHRYWLRRPEPYRAFLIATLVFAPVLLWNRAHGWASFVFQASRAVPAAGRPGTPLVDALLGQAAWLLPWIWLPLVMVLLRATRVRQGDPPRWLLACLALGPVVGFTLIAALGRKGLAHWPMPGYFFALPLLGAAVAARLAQGDPRARRWLSGAAVGLLAVLVVLTTHVATGWIGAAWPALLSRDDPSLVLQPWTPLPRVLSEWGHPLAGEFVAGATWADAAKAGHALGPGVPVTAIGPDSRGFAFVSEPGALLGRDGLIVVRRRPGPEPLQDLARYFERIEPLGTFFVPFRRPSSVAVSVYRGHRLRGLAAPPSGDGSEVDRWHR